MSFNQLNPFQQTYFFKLLHIENNKSLITRKAYFFSDKIENEFSATITALARDKSEYKDINLHPQCLFPERTRFIKSLGVELPEIYCPDFEEWKKAINPKGLWLIFSSHYANNPASTFGHTFLRFENPKNAQDPLLDYATNFAASNDPNDPGFVYAMKGIFGFYKGYFSLSPYYMMVSIYNNTESRDLLEYKINMSSEATQSVLNHLWELFRNGEFEYYFFDRNCSYVLSRLIDLGLFFDGKTSSILDLNRFYYLPSDVVWRLQKENLITDYSIRHSAKFQFLQQYSHLNAAQITDYNLNKESRDSAVIDAHLKFLNYKKFDHNGKLSNEDELKLRKFLVQRAAVDEAPITLIPDISRDIRLAHAPQSFTFYQKLGKNSFSGATFKSGYHSLIDSDEGNAPYSEFDFLSLSVNFLPKLKISEYSFINVVSMNPINVVERMPSWLIRTHSWYLINHTDLTHEIRAQGGFAIDSSKYHLVNALYLGISESLLDQKLYSSGVATLISTFQTPINSKIIFKPVLEQSLFKFLKDKKNQNLFRDYFYEFKLSLGLSIKPHYQLSVDGLHQYSSGLNKSESEYALRFKFYF